MIFITLSSFLKKSAVLEETDRQNLWLKLSNMRPHGRDIQPQISILNFRLNILITHCVRVYVAAINKKSLKSTFVFSEIPQHEPVQVVGLRTRLTLFWQKQEK